MGRFFLSFLAHSSRHDRNLVKDSKSSERSRHVDSICSTLKKRMLNLRHGTVKQMREKKPTPHFQKIESKTRKKSDESNLSSTPFVKTWLRRVLRKKETSPKFFRKSSLFPRRNRLRTRRTNHTVGSTSPTNSRTVTDESTYCYRSEESPHRILLVKQLSFRSSRIDDNHSLCCEDNHEGENEIFEENSCESSLFPLTERPPEKGEEKANDDELHNFSYLYHKSEIIEKLFPLTHPNTRSEDASTGNREMLHFVENDNQTSKNVDSTIEKIHVRNNESPFHRSEIIRFLFPMGHPDHQEKKGFDCNIDNIEAASTSASLRDTDTYLEEEMIDMVNNIHDRVDLSPSEVPIDDNSNECIGLIISFDPTWDLLSPDLTACTTNMPKSRLKKFHEIENYKDSLLGRLTGEESSVDSTDLLTDIKLNFDSETRSFSSNYSLNEFSSESKPTDSFSLGYHFDCERFPIIDSSEHEICFYSDELSVENIDDFVDDKRRHTSCGIENLKFQESYELFICSDDSDDCMRGDEAVCTDSISGQSSLQSTDCVEYEWDIRSTLQELVASTKLNSLSSMSSPQQLFTSDDLYLLTEMDESSSTPNKKITMKQVQGHPIESLYLPQLGPTLSGGLA